MRRYSVILGALLARLALPGQARADECTVFTFAARSARQLDRPRLRMPRDSLGIAPL